MQNDKTEQELTRTDRPGFGPQLFFRWIFLYQAVFPLKIPWAAKGLLSLSINMKQISINLFRSFSLNEIAFALGLSYTTTWRLKKRLEKEGLIDAEGWPLFDISDPEHKVLNARR